MKCPQRPLNAWLIWIRICKTSYLPHFVSNCSVLQYLPARPVNTITLNNKHFVSRYCFESNFGTGLAIHKQMVVYKNRMEWSRADKLLSEAERTELSSALRNVSQVEEDKIEKLTPLAPTVPPHPYQWRNSSTISLGISALVLWFYFVPLFLLW